MFQPHQTAELCNFVYVALDLEVSIELNTQLMIDGCSLKIRGYEE